ncbi:hypothetical protein [Azospirillum melinis]|uniref:hypothetical protein n=1 Tax=Azospirillum melinis TaxID=328839 RepID=UPI00157A4C76|nr:hypothetical protein [Azospirillum melinis]MBP2310472.1 hypothetical protein [Azospirillum melinis]
MDEDLSPAARAILDRYGFADGDECRRSPHGHHEGKFGEDGERRCFWCGRVMEEDDPS